MDRLMEIGANVWHYGIPFLIVLGIVVFVHEFGHFFVARRCGVKVDAFSLGMGPEICGREDKHGTRWKLSWIPLGGYVKMFGDEDPTSATPDAEKLQALSEDDKKKTFFYQPVNNRLAIAAAGPFMNYLFGVVVLAFLFLLNGQPFTAPVVDQVMPESAAAEAGFEKGDRILTIDREKIQSFEDIKRIVGLNAGSPITILYERGEEQRTVRVTPKVMKMTDRLGGEHVQGLLGIGSSALNYRDLGPGESVIAAFEEVWNMTAGTLKGVGQMILGTRPSDELGGPLRIAEMSGKVAQEGWAAFLWFMAVISVNLGLINLFPIPLLDGGHLLFYGIEKIRGKPLSDRALDTGAKIGAAAVLSLMLLATWNDLVHLRVVAFLRGLFS